MTGPSVCVTLGGLQSLASQTPTSEPAKRVTKGLAPDLCLQEIGILQENFQITARKFNLYKLDERKEKREIERVGRHGRVLSGRSRVQGRRGDTQTRQTTRTQSSKHNFTLGYVRMHLMVTLRLFTPHTAPAKASLESSLKRHTAFIKRAKQSIGIEHRDQLLKDIDGLTLERYVDEIATAVIEGVARCKNDKDVWSATEVCLRLSCSIRTCEARGDLLGCSWCPDYFRPPSAPHASVLTEDRTAFTSGSFPSPACRTRIRPARACRGPGKGDSRAGRAPAAAVACLCGACYGRYHR